MATKKSPLKVMIAIVRRDKLDTAVDIMNTMGANAGWSLLGHGVGRTDIMNLLGLHSSECGVIISIIQEEKAHKTLGALCRNLEFYKPNRGFAFTVPLNAISRNTLSAFKQWGREAEEQSEQFNPNNEANKEQQKTDTAEISKNEQQIKEKQIVLDDVLKQAEEKTKEANK